MMNHVQRNKLIIILSLLLLLSTATGLVLYALKQNINLFLTPTELLQSTTLSNQRIRIGGYVQKDSVLYNDTGETITFKVTDRKNDITVIYHGVLPSLFREGQTVVVTGKLSNHLLLAEQVLAKHDEKYRPK